MSARIRDSCTEALRWLYSEQQKKKQKNKDFFLNAHSE